MKKLYVWLIALAGIMMTACSAPQNITYLQNATDGTVVELPALKDMRIRPEDKISIVVHSKDPALATLFNLQVVQNRVGAGTAALSSNSNQVVSYYTVNQHGDIDFPLIGKIHVAGMNRQELTEYIKKRLVDEGLLKDPIVTMEFLNAGVSVMGEVGKPGRYDITRDQLNLLEALSMAGDLTINGKRENVLVIRTENGKQTTYRVDLTDAKSVYSSPAYYLQQNDMVYVEPNDKAKRASTVNGNNVLSASFWVSVASLLTSIAVLIFK